MLRRLPARARLALAYGAAMSALLAGCGIAIFVSVSATLLDEQETGLRARAATVAADLADVGFRLRAASPALLEPTEEFVQIATERGALLDSTPGVATRALTAEQIAGASTPRWFDGRVPAVTGSARMLVVPVRIPGREERRVIVGASNSDRSDALRQLTRLMLLGGPGAVAVASLIGWLLSGRALRPVDRMRAEAKAISLSGLDHRLSVPMARDEIRRLALTLNEMLGRLESAARSERRFLDDASHQLRTPLATLSMELDLAVRQPRTPAQQHQALVSALAETRQLTELTENLLVTARRSGRRTITRSSLTLDELLHRCVSHFATAAADKHVRIVVDVDRSDPAVRADAHRLGQAVDNLVDNALRHTAAHSTISVRGRVTTAADGAATARITVTDNGPGFASAAVAGAHDGHGLGLAFVTATVAAHGGTVAMRNTADGAQVTVDIPSPR